MSPERRWVIALALLFFGVRAVFLGGGQVAMCLGPLGVTAVQCYAASGRVPEIGVGLPLLALCLAGVSLAIAPIPRRHWRVAAIAALLAGLEVAVLYVVLRPRTMEGSGSGGQWYVVPLPLDTAGVATAAIVGAALGAHLMARIVELRAARGSSRRQPARSRP